MGDDIEAVEKLADGEECYIAWFQGSGGRVERHGGTYSLFEVGACGKDSHHEDYTRDRIVDMVHCAHSWS